MGGQRYLLYIHTLLSSCCFHDFTFRRKVSVRVKTSCCPVYRPCDQDSLTTVCSTDIFVPWMILSNRLTRSQKTDTLYPDLPLVYVLCCRKVWSLWNSVCECVRHPSNHVWWVFYLDWVEIISRPHVTTLSSMVLFAASAFLSFLFLHPFSSFPPSLPKFSFLNLFHFPCSPCLTHSCFPSVSSLVLLFFLSFPSFHFLLFFIFVVHVHWQKTGYFILFYSSSLSFCLFSPTSFLSFTSVLWSLVLLYSCCFPSLRNVRTWLAPLKRWRWSSLLCYKNRICDKLFNFLNWIVLTMPSLRSYY